MPSVPDPTSVKPWYLRNITEALALDTTSGNVYVRTNAEITGNVTIPGSVDAHISEFGNIDITGSTLPATVYQGTDPWKVTGNITIDPGQTIEVTQGTDPWIVEGNVNAAVTGTVAVSSITGNIAGITANVTVVDGGGSLTIDGNVGITGSVSTTFPAGATDLFGELYSIPITPTVQVEDRKSTRLNSSH